MKHSCWVSPMCKSPAMPHSAWAARRASRTVINVGDAVKGSDAQPIARCIGPTDSQRKRWGCRPIPPTEGQFRRYSSPGKSGEPETVKNPADLAQLGRSSAWGSGCGVFGSHCPPVGDKDRVARPSTPVREREDARARVGPTRLGRQALSAPSNPAVVLLGRPYNTHDPFLNLRLGHRLELTASWRSIRETPRAVRVIPRGPAGAPANPCLGNDS